MTIFLAGIGWKARSVACSDGQIESPPLQADAVVLLTT